MLVASAVWWWRSPLGVRLTHLPIVSRLLTLKAYLPSLFLRCLGMPKGFRPTPDQRAVILESEESLFPIRPRKQGVLYDNYISTHPPGRSCWRSTKAATCCLGART